MSLAFGVTFQDLTFGVTFGGAGAVAPPSGIPPIARGSLSRTVRALATLVKQGGHVDRFYKGYAESLVVTVTDAAGVAIAINAGAYQVATIEYTLRIGQLEDAGAVALTKTYPNGGIALSTQSGATLGQAVITITDDDTAALAPGLYYEQVAVTFADAPTQEVLVVPPQRRVVYAAVA